jgi:hypothetical protein
MTHDEALVATVEASMAAAASERPQSVTAATD